MPDRAFRSPASIQDEKVTRALVAAFVIERGWMHVLDRRERNGQTIQGRLPGGQTVAARVKLCWRRAVDGRDGERHSDYSAAQLMARITEGDWAGSIRDKIRREAAQGTTHLLIAQRDGDLITKAALIPLGAVLPIWELQRDISNALIADGRLGRRQKNHAMNGQSPTLWLQDSRGGESVAAALWTYPGVIDLSAREGEGGEDALPDQVPASRTYREGAVRTVVVNAYERDRRARRACIDVHGARCAVCGFSFAEQYGPLAAGHIHVHHLRPVALAGGEYTLDPVADLRPVCANCHSVIHLGGECRSLEEVRALLQAPRGTSA